MVYFIEFAQDNLFSFSFSLSFFLSSTFTFLVFPVDSIGAHSFVLQDSWDSF